LYKTFLLKGLEFIKNNCQIPKTKSTGEIYKRYEELLYEVRKYNEALEIINELNLYNKNIPYKQLQAKIEKALAIYLLVTIQNEFYFCDNKNLNFKN